MSKDFERQSQDFLWYSYFGITKTDAENYKDKALEACIDRAYQDLPRTLSYKYSIEYLKNNPDNYSEEEFKALKDNFEALKENYKECISKKIFYSIKDLLNEDKSFAAWHETTSNLIVSISKGEKENEQEYRYGESLFKKENNEVEFYYGQAQKWLNMTLKYMLVMGLWGIEKYKDSLHVPIDNYIYKAAKKATNEPIYKNDAENKDVVTGLNVKQIKRNISKDNKENNEDVAWSRINQEEYNNYQNEIRKSINNSQYNSSIEWEFDAWIAQAKEEKRIEQEKQKNKKENKNK